MKGVRRMGMMFRKTKKIREKGGRGGCYMFLCFSEEESHYEYGMSS